jgi:hypothetical protein
MNGDRKVRDPERMGAMGSKEMDIRGKVETPGHLACRIMIAINQENRNIVGGKPAHLGYEKESGLIILPVSVIEISGQDHKIDLLFNRPGHKIFKGFPCCLLNAPCIVSLLAGQPPEGTVKVDIRSVYKTKHRHSILLPDKKTVLQMEPKRLHLL